MSKNKSAKQTQERQAEMNKAFQQYKMTMAIVTNARVQQERNENYEKKWRK